MIEDDSWFFELNAFSPGWVEEVPQKQPVKSEFQHKDLDILEKELDEIKEHIQDIEAREWQIAKLIHFNDANFAKE